MQNSLDIVFENNNLFVVNKPSGVTVNRADTTNGNTLQDQIERERDIDMSEDPEFVDRAGIVHRLDKETSGALIVAKNSNAFKKLQLQFKERKVKKEYVALSHGKIKPPDGLITAPVGRLPWNRKRFGIVAGGREAETRYAVESYYEFNKEPLSYVRLFPKTGRTHQIRVHLKHIGNPIFADELYAGRKTARGDRKYIDRLFLHAEKIIFYDPESNDEIVSQVKLPMDLQRLLEKLTLTNNN